MVAILIASANPGSVRSIGLPSEWKSYAKKKEKKKRMIEWKRNGIRSARLRASCQDGYTIVSVWSHPLALLAYMLERRTNA
jgi:hypothetical protein